MKKAQLHVMGASWHWPLKSILELVLGCVVLKNQLALATVPLNYPLPVFAQPDQSPTEQDDRTPGRLQAVWPPPKTKDTEEKVGLKYTEAGNMKGNWHPGRSLFLQWPLVQVQRTVSVRGVFHHALRWRRLLLLLVLVRKHTTFHICYDRSSQGWNVTAMQWMEGSTRVK